MLQIVEFFKFIVSFFTFLIDLIWGLIQVLFSIPTFIVTVFGAIPIIFQVVILGIIAISITYKIISLGGSGE